MRAAVIVSLLAIGTPALGDVPALDTGTTVKVYVVRDVSDHCLNLLWAKSIASQILAEAGVHIKWQLGEPRRGEGQASIIIDLTSNTPNTFEPGALAYAHLYEGVHIRVFCDRVQNATRGVNPVSTFLLAHVIAHEIVHMLEGIDRHSKQDS